MCMKTLGEQGVSHCQDSKKEQKDRSTSGRESSILRTHGELPSPPPTICWWQLCIWNSSVFSSWELSAKRCSARWELEYLPVYQQNQILPCLKMQNQSIYQQYMVHQIPHPSATLRYEFIFIVTVISVHIISIYSVTFQFKYRVWTEQ